MSHCFEHWNINSKWTSTGASLGGWRGEVLSAPFFRKVFALTESISPAELKICGLGYYELYINGKKVGDHVLDPVVTHYDKRSLYLTYDVSEYLVSGVNVVGVVLGNGWYNCHTPEVWHFDKAPWRDYPKFLLQMNVGGECVLASDQTWKHSFGPILFDGLRNGESYDARLELDGWLEVGYDDSTWLQACTVAPPGGILEEQKMPPCRVMKTLIPVKQWDTSEGVVYDIGQNMAGWARMHVKGERGAKITLQYAERLDDNKRSERSKIAQHVLVEPGEFQTDRYILRGEGLEIWEPRFTYHGFQYVQAIVEGDAKIEKLEGRVVYTSFEKIGRFACSDETVNKLQECTEWSYVGNFVGIPTDCPHREKNGWTGDAQLAAETGLFNYDAASAYAQWIDSIVDAQRPSGQLPGIIPSAGWGYNWGSGPAWDSALILIPWYVYLYTGDDSIIRKHYDAMKKYVDYCSSMADGNIVDFGLGDWAHPDQCKNDYSRIAGNAITDTGYYYLDSMLLAKFSELAGHAKNQITYGNLAERIKESFNKKFYQGDGIYGKGEPTAMACALYHGLAAESEKKSVLNALVKSVRDNRYKADFGILGAKYIPRALADNGKVEDAYRVITQPEYPGWANWLRQGATTLWESWRGASSLNHIMFGDVSAWFYQYLAGITPVLDKPGFAHFILKPNFIKSLNWVKAEYRTAYGIIRSSWRRRNTEITYECEIPPQSTAKVVLGKRQPNDLSCGKYEFTIHP